MTEGFFLPKRPNFFPNVPARDFCIPSSYRHRREKLIKTTHKHMTHSTSTPTLAQQVANAVMTPQGAEVNTCTSYIILGTYVCTYMCGCSHCAGRWGNHQPFLPLFGVFTRTPTYPTKLIQGTPTNGTNDRHYVRTSVTQMSLSSHVCIHPRNTTVPIPLINWTPLYPTLFKVPPLSCDSLPW